MSLVYKTSRGPVLGDVLVSEVLPDLTRAQRTLLAGSGSDRTLRIGEIVGRILFGTPTEDHTGNTGNGAMSGLALKANAQLGDYTVECITATTNAATFAVFDPLGRRLADAATDVAYDNGEIAFTIADGVTDFAAGDSFTITVPVGSKKFVPLSLTAVDGSARPAGFSAIKATAPDGVDAPFVNIERLATFKSTGLIYPTGATTDQKTAILADLEALNLKALNAA